MALGIGRQIVVFGSGLAVTLAACSVAPYVVLINDTSKTVVVHQPKYMGAEKTDKHRIGPGDARRFGLFRIGESLRIDIDACVVSYRPPEFRERPWVHPPRIDARLSEDLTIAAIPPYAGIDRKAPKAELYEKYGVVLQPTSKVCGPGG